MHRITGISSESVSTRFSYDENSNLTGITTPSEYTFNTEHDADDRVTK